MNLTTTNQTLTISHNQLAEVTGKRQDNVKRTMESLEKQGVITFTQTEEKGSGRPLTVYWINEKLYSEGEV